MFESSSAPSLLSSFYSIFLEIRLSYFCYFFRLHFVAIQLVYLGIPKAQAWTNLLAARCKHSYEVISHHRGWLLLGWEWSMMNYASLVKNIFQVYSVLWVGLILNASLLWNSCGVKSLILLCCFYLSVICVTAQIFLIQKC